MIETFSHRSQQQIVCQKPNQKFRISYEKNPKNQKAAAKLKRQKNNNNNNEKYKQNLCIL